MRGCTHVLPNEKGCRICDAAPSTPSEKQELTGVLKDIQNFLDGTRLGDSDCLLLGEHDAKLILSALTSVETKLKQVKEPRP